MQFGIACTFLFTFPEVFWQLLTFLILKLLRIVPLCSCKMIILWDYFPFLHFLKAAFSSGHFYVLQNWEPVKCLVSTYYGNFLEFAPLSTNIWKLPNIWTELVSLNLFLTKSRLHLPMFILLIGQDCSHVTWENWKGVGRF